MADVEARKIRKWAELGDRTDPETVGLDRDVGWPASYSDRDGDTPERRVFHQLFRELTGLAVDVIREGILPWDAEIDYRVGAVVKRNSRLWMAAANTGPIVGVVDPATPGQTRWFGIRGRVEVPSAPPMPVVEVGNTVLLWSWACPLDGGSVIVRFDLQWRVDGGGWSASVPLDRPVRRLSGLTNGRAYEARVRAVNAVGEGGWSPVATATPVADAPDQVVGLRASPRDGFVLLDWLVPGNGGSPLTGYQVQYRSGSQAFGPSRQQSATRAPFAVSLPNDVEYHFRVRAVNAVGEGGWSPVATGTPVADVTPAPVPDRVPDAPVRLTGTPVRPYGARFAWFPAADDGGKPVSGFDLQWRLVGNTWSGNVTRVTAGCFLDLTGFTSGQGVEARVRAVNSVGEGGWSATVTVAASEMLAPIPQKVESTTLHTGGSIGLDLQNPSPRFRHSDHGTDPQPLDRTVSPR